MLNITFHYLYIYEYLCFGRHCGSVVVVIKTVINSGNKLLRYFNGLRSMPEKAGCLVTGLSWIRTQREVLPLTITHGYGQKIQNKIDANKLVP